MEDSTTTSATIDIYRGLREDGYDNVVLALQAYLRRTRDDVRALLPLAPTGAARQGDLDRQPATVAYSRPRDDPRQLRPAPRRAARRRRVRRDRLPRRVDPLAGLLEAIDRHERDAGAYEFQMLLGVRAYLGDALVERGHRVRVYVPYGEDWHAYSVRRFKENPRLARHVAADIVSRARGRRGR